RRLLDASIAPAKWNNVPVSLPQSVLNCSRISQNRRKSALLVAVAILAVLPFILALSCAIAAFVPGTFGFLGFASEVSHSFDKSDRPVFQGDPADWGEQLQVRRADLQRQMRVQEESRRREEEFGRWFRNPVMLGIAAFLSAVLAFLIWAVFSSPASHL